jgi:hypothetical protein
VAADVGIMTADAIMSVGVVIERRDIDNPWLDHSWHPVAIIPHATGEARWSELRSGEGWAQFHAANLNLELFRGETEGYRTNLAQQPPTVFVVLRPGEEADEMDVEPFHVTVCPYEAMGYHESGDEIVEGVPMPPELAAWVAEFVDRYHVDTPFKKRKNKRHRDQADGSRPRGRFSGEPT